MSIPGKVWVGCAGYSYPHWRRNKFYPVGLKAAEELNYYSKHFSCVELNTTFYRIPTSKMVEEWKSRTPEGFLFVVKVPQLLTHDLELRNVRDPWEAFHASIAPFHDKLGPVLFQLPPTFTVNLGVW